MHSNNKQDIHGTAEASRIRGTCHAFPEVLHMLHMLHPWSILALGGRCLFHTWAWASYLLRNSFFFFQQSSNIQFLNSCRMELCLMASWWMRVFSLFCCLWQSLDTVVGVLFYDQGLISDFCFVCLLPVFIAFQFVIFLIFVCGIVGLWALPY